MVPFSAEETNQRERAGVYFTRSRGIAPQSSALHKGALRRPEQKSGSGEISHRSVGDRNLTVVVEDGGSLREPTLTLFFKLLLIMLK